MNHMVSVCPFTKSGVALQSLHEAGDDAIHWLERLQHSPNEIEGHAFPVFAQERETSWLLYD